MENKKAAILVLAIAAAVAITAAGVYAMGRPLASNGYPYANSSFGPGMMGRSTGYTGGMMGNYGGYSGMMGSAGYPMYQYMQEYMWHYWNSRSVP